MSTSIYELFHYSLFPGLFVAFTYNKKEPPVFGAAPAIWCILLSFLGLPFRHIPNNLSNDNELTASAPFFYQISGTWSNHEGSILSWCRILSFYGFLLCYRGRPQSHDVSKRGGHRENLFYSYDSNFVKNSILSLPSYEQKIGATTQLYTPFVLRTLVDSELRSRRHQTFDGSWHCFVFSSFLSASSDPFVRNFFVRTEPLVESNPVPQDPISAIHPPCIYAGDVASAMGFGLCRSKMMNGIVALHSPPMRKDDAEKNGRLFRSTGCVGSRIRRKLFTLKFKHVGAKGYPALLLRSNRSLLMLLWRRFAFSSLLTGALVDTGREQTKRVVRNGKKETTTSLFCWISGANTVVSDQDQEPIRILILTCRWWFRDPVENASFMPRVLATARIHSVILPLLHSWTSILNIVTLPCCVSRTFSIRSGLLAPVHNFATDDTRGIFLWWFFRLITDISMIIFSQMKQQASVRRTYKKRWLWREVLLCTYVTELARKPAPASNWLSDFVPQLE
ncbi:putative cytochrome c assembly protein [Helianthus annuus]|nr:putative cytochrome c assembly protein [Helianthus annuus]KAJ0688758.1 putative cytochrome c assembly protein [Helianthus annuus]